MEVASYVRRRQSKLQHVVGQWHEINRHNWAWIRWVVIFRNAKNTAFVGFKKNCRGAPVPWCSLQSVSSEISDLPLSFCRSCWAYHASLRLLGLKQQGGAVHAVPQAGGRGPVVKHVPNVAQAARTAHLQQRGKGGG